MIRVTRLNGSELIINGELIQEVESTPDTVITLMNGKKMMVKESTKEVIQAVVEYKRALFGNFKIPEGD
jgi:flagellar protein FlbD